MTETVHGWFGLSYANYLVLPRTLLQSMPEAWQQRFVQRLSELDDAFSHVPQAEAYEVIAGEEHSLADLSDVQLRHLGYLRESGDEDTESGDGETRYYDRDGNEVDHPDCYRVVWPTKDPVPHYNRGRARIEPRIPQELTEKGTRDD